jgi:TrmH family RNA methyltransferase
MPISSTANNTVRSVRRLRKRAWRERRGLVLLEGKRTVTAALRAGVTLAEVLFTEGGGEAALLEGAKRAGARVHEVTPEIMAHLTSAVSAPSILAVGPLVESSLDAAPSGGALVLDGVRDPAAVGGLIATAAAVGMASVAVGTGCADPFTPKVLRAAGAAHYALRLIRRVEASDAVAKLGGDGVRTVTLATDGPAPWEMDLRGPIVLVVGGEIAGEAVCVPATAAGAPPLTAVTAVVLYEWLKQGGNTR